MNAANCAGYRAHYWFFYYSPNVLFRDITSHSNFYENLLFDFIMWSKKELFMIERLIYDFLRSDLL